MVYSKSDLSYTLIYFFCTSLLQEQAFELSQKYKEGKFIIELSHMIKDNGWDWEGHLHLSSWLFQKLNLLNLKGFQCSFLIPRTSHRCATLSLRTALPRIACDALSSVLHVFPATTTTHLLISLSQLLVVLGHGLNECRVCVWKTGRNSHTGTCACWILKREWWNLYQQSRSVGGDASASQIIWPLHIWRRYLGFPFQVKVHI